MLTSSKYLIKTDRHNPASSTLLFVGVCIWICVWVVICNISSIYQRSELGNLRSKWTIRPYGLSAASSFGNICWFKTIQTTAHHIALVEVPRARIRLVLQHGATAAETTSRNLQAFAPSGVLNWRRTPALWNTSRRPNSWPMSRDNRSASFVTTETHRTSWIIS